MTGTSRGLGGTQRVLACPVCGQAMRVEVKELVTADVCDEHGIWFDAGEFDSVVMRLHKRIRRGGYAAVRRAKRSGRMEGALFGWWSLLRD